MALNLDALNLRLLGDWQRGFPLVPRPFAEIAAGIGCTEAEVLKRLTRLTETGAVSRVGATIRPNTVGASTLAAVAAPEARIDEVAAIIGAESGVNHSYQRENGWNLWFVATGPDRAHVDATLARIGNASGLPVLDLRLVRPYHIDLGFSLDGTRQKTDVCAETELSALRPGDRDVLQALARGLALQQQPFAVLARKLGRSEQEVLDRVRALVDAGFVSRIGIILRHRSLGWQSNAMVVWQVPEEDIDRAGAALSVAPGVTLCYQRRPDARHWPYNLYCMIHSRSRDEAMALLARAAELAGLSGIEHKILFSLRCFKQTGAMVQHGREAAA